MERHEKLHEFIRQNYYADLMKLSKEEKPSLVIDFSLLDRFDPLIADQLLATPEKIFEDFKKAIKSFDITDEMPVRVRNLPERRAIRLRNLRAEHIGQFIATDVIIKSASEVKPQIIEVIFRCPECETLIPVPQEDAQLMRKASVCESCGRRGEFPMVEKKMTDFRSLKGVEPFEITQGEQPSEMIIFLSGNLTTPKLQRKTDPGSRLRIYGMLKELPHRIKGKITTKMDTFFDTNYFESTDIEYEELDITPEDEAKIIELSGDPKIYERLRSSLAPGIYGYEEIKEAIALQLFGGVVHTLPDRSHIRGNIHILLTGDPSVGKSLIGSSRILHNSDDGPEFTELGKLVNYALQEGAVKVIGDSEVCFENKSGIKVLSINPHTHKSEWKPVTAFIRHESPKTLIKVKTKSGREVVATKNHSFVTLNADGKIIPIMGEDLSKAIYLPIPLGNHRQLFAEVDTGLQVKRTNSQLLPPKIKLDWDFGFFLGMFLAEGSTPGDGRVSIASKSDARLEPIRRLAEALGLRYYRNPTEIAISSRRLVEFLKTHCYKGEKIGNVKGSGARRKAFPNFCFFAPAEFLKGLASGLFSGDGYFVNAGVTGKSKANLKVELTTTGPHLAHGLVEMLSLMGIFAVIRDKPYYYKNESRRKYEVTVTGRYARDLLSKIELIGKPPPKVNRFSERDAFDSVPCGDLLYKIVRMLGYSRKTHQDAQKRRTFAAMMRTVRSRNKIGKRRLEKILTMLSAEAEVQRNSEARNLISDLRRIVESGVVWDQVISVEKILSSEKYVYDLSVDGNETFASNNLMVHNSVILKLGSSIVPRGKYVSGTGATGAGMCTTGDTLVQLADGKVVKIGELVEPHISKGWESPEPGIWTAKGDGTSIVALGHDMKMSKKPITKYWKLLSPSKLVELTTRSGRKVRVTPDNPIPVTKDGEIIWLSAKDIKIGEHVAVPRILPGANSNTTTLDSIDFEARLVNSEATVNSIVDYAKKNGTIRKLAKTCNVPENSLYHGWRGRKAPKLSDLDKVCKASGLSLAVLLPDDLVLEQWLGHKIRLPKTLNENIMYALGLIAGDGSISQTKYNGFNIKFSSAEKELLTSFENIAKTEFGIVPKYYKHPERIAYLSFNSKIIAGLARSLGIPHGDKAHGLNITQKLSELPNKLIAPYLRGLFDTDGYVSIRKTRGSNIVGFSTVSEAFARGVQLLLLRFGILSKIRSRPPHKSMIRGGEVISGESWTIEISGSEKIEAFANYVGFSLTRKCKALDHIRVKSVNTNVDIIPNIENLLHNARKKSGLTAKEVYGYKAYAYEKGKRKPSREWLAAACKNLHDHESVELEKLRVLADSDIFWDEIKSVDFVEGVDYVYDVTVEGDHSFVANSMIIHNTASVRKDEILGTWVLEAGALILCNKGLISIDEFDKLNKEDQVAMHEAMSVETVSIAKASIVATLPAQTAVLAGANPKLGRFDPYRTITEQIDIPETLMSRFDLKFVLRDIPDRSHDEMLADHVITSRISPEAITPEINVGLLRKYIAYARNKVASVALAPEAAKMLKDFYVDMRNAAPDSGVVSITLRQYEALLRLAEASAKVRLDNHVRISDAERSIRLMRYSLMQLGYDKDTGQIDIDRIESGIGATQRSKIRTILEIIETLQKQTGKEVAVDDVEAEAESQGIDKPGEVIEKLKREGMVFEPKPGFIKKL